MCICFTLCMFMIYFTDFEIAVVWMGTHPESHAAVQLVCLIAQKLRTYVWNNIVRGCNSQFGRFKRKCIKTVWHFNKIQNMYSSKLMKNH